MRTTKIVLEAVKQDGLLLRYVKNDANAPMCNLGSIEAKSAGTQVCGKKDKETR
jgi:hypothetical protein